MVIDGNVIHLNSKIFILNEEILNLLKELAIQSPLKRSRICLHKDLDAPVQEMIIAAHKSAAIGAHKHPANKAESYHMIEGQLSINIYNDLGHIEKSVYLFSNANPRMYRIEGNTWHEPIPTSDWAIYHEIYQGPFNKDIDVTYL